eukprot:scaffold16111_cov172-Amphora_coffeaeformis.AAC.8
MLQLDFFLKKRSDGLEESRRRIGLPAGTDRAWTSVAREMGPWIWTSLYAVHLDEAPHGRTLSKALRSPSAYW